MCIEARQPTAVWESVGSRNVLPVLHVLYCVPSGADYRWGPGFSPSTPIRGMHTVWMWQEDHEHIIKKCRHLDDSISIVWCLWRTVPALSRTHTHLDTVPSGMAHVIRPSCQVAHVVHHLCQMAHQVRKYPTYSPRYPHYCITTMVLTVGRVAAAVPCLTTAGCCQYHPVCHYYFSSVPPSLGGDPPKP